MLKKKVLFILAIVLFLVVGACCFKSGTAEAKSKYKYRIQIPKIIYAKIGKKLTIKPVVYDNQGKKIKVKKSKFVMDWGYRSNEGGGLMYYSQSKVVMKKVDMFSCYNGPNESTYTIYLGDRNSDKLLAKPKKIKIYATNIRKYIKRPKIKIEKIKLKKKKTVEIEYDLVNAKYGFYCTGLKVQYSRNRNFAKSKTIVQPYTIVRFKKLKKGKYYFRIRGYGLYNKVKYYGRWSNVKSKKIK